MSQWAIVLAGGSGTRFWPLSTPDNPKQFLPLAGDQPLLVSAVDRLGPLIPPEHILVVTAARYVDATRRLLPNVPGDNVLGEPRPASTGPALAWGTWEIQQRDAEATVLSTHADWWVGDPDAFRSSARLALDAATQHDRLITVGIVPTRPDVSYGYVIPGEGLDDQVRAVRRFQEKPRAEEADRLIRGGALWNSGLFAWTTARFFEETRTHAPEIWSAILFLERADVTGFFAAVTPIAIDVSHFERSGRVGVVAGDFPWDDVGKWSALARVRSADDDGNVLVGEAYQHDASGCIVWSDGDPIVIDGVEDLVVVRANGITLVTSSERANQLKALLEVLPEHVRIPGGSSQPSS